MKDDKRTVMTGPAVPVRGNDIDTDRIIPARFLKSITFEGLGEHVFADDRAQLADAGKTHALDDPRFSDATILLVNKNFGCGSSREHAPQALNRWHKGIQAIVGESFSEIFFGNCLTIGIPAVAVDEVAMARLMAAAETGAEVRVDLESKTVSAGEESFPARIAEGARSQLVFGSWDTTAELLSAESEIAKTAEGVPYFHGW